MGCRAHGSRMGDLMKSVFGVIAFSCVIAVASSAAAQSLTGPQRNAVRAAENYLRMMPFSRDGLIDQLSSPYGDQFDVADATVAVDSLMVDWNAQAVRSAEQYLRMMGFSCRGLIEQLSMEIGEQFTRAQAEYGARQAGAC